MFTENVSQHPHYFYPKTEGSYDSLLYGFFPVVVELPEPLKCTKIALITGNLEKVVMGDGSGTLKQNYSGYHMFGSNVFCIK